MKETKLYKIVYGADHISYVVGDDVTEALYNLNTYFDKEVGEVKSVIKVEDIISYDTSN